MPITILTFIFSKFFPFILFGRIWSKNLKFFKSAEISYRGTLVYPYYGFNVYFFKIFVIHNILSNLSQNLKFSKLMEIWYKCTLLYASHDFNVYFFKTFFCHTFLGKFDLKIWGSPINWTMVQGYIAVCLLRF